MERCWFILRHSTYRPPSDESLRWGLPDGPLCLGHLVSNLGSLDVINRRDFEPFPEDMMPGQPSTTHDLPWSDDDSRTVGVTGTTSLPILNGIPGVDAEATVGAVFRKRVARHHNFARLDFWTTSPSRLYVSKCLELREVSEHIKRVSSLFGAWSMYMITGLAVARGCGPSRMTEKTGVIMHGSVNL